MSSATNVYITRDGAGAKDGTSCAAAYAYNDATNGLNTSGVWVAGNARPSSGAWTAGALSAATAPARTTKSSGRLVF